MPCSDGREPRPWELERDEALHARYDNERHRNETLEFTNQQLRARINATETTACWLARQLGSWGMPADTPEYVWQWIDTHRILDTNDPKPSDSPYPLPERNQKTVPAPHPPVRVPPSIVLVNTEDFVRILFNIRVALNHVDNKAALAMAKMGLTTLEEYVPDAFGNPRT